ncbi:hypothetical protein L211DRAFT_853593 [Terfezia boudieri ATCC MYA-4762]|uniref:CCHC-type domain-containing protein n=1 Tax=Terfezia boudieri ATCC MYA-4762 TaxID=1051890 RepID=A0A3N4L7Z1_9PEZI|nr:hypothetical protein L211DRAFT_853593 [Terfezia boudieri ATCC MYA-4762]
MYLDLSDTELSDIDSDVTLSDISSDVTQFSEITERLNICRPHDIRQHSTPNPFWDEMKLDDYTLYDLLWIGMFGNFLKWYQGELADIGKYANSDMHNLCWGVCEIPTPCTILTPYRRIPQMDPRPDGIYILSSWHPNLRMHVNCCGDELVEILGSLRSREIRQLTMNPNWLLSCHLLHIDLTGMVSGMDESRPRSPWPRSPRPRSPRPDLECFACNRLGHMTEECPNPTSPYICTVPTEGDLQDRSCISTPEEELYASMDVAENVTEDVAEDVVEDGSIWNCQIRLGLGMVHDEWVTRVA